jgi:uncharacterized protein (TIGR00369 family)
MSTNVEEWRQAMARGMSQTPFVAGLDGVTVEGGNGFARMRLPYSEKLVGNPDTGVVHGGVITGMLDQCCGTAVGTGLPNPSAIATLDLRIDYMKPARPGADIIFEARCLKVTQDVAFARGVAYQDSPDDPIANATAAFMLTNTGGAGMPLTPA